MTAPVSGNGIGFSVRSGAGLAARAFAKVAAIAGAKTGVRAPKLSRAKPADPTILLTFHDIPVLPNTALYHNNVLGDGGPIWPELRPELRHYQAGKPIDRPAQIPQEALAESLKSAEPLTSPCLWGGYALLHFGHLIGEHLTRIAAARAQRPADPVLFTLAPGKGPASLSDWFWDVVGWYGLAREDVRFITRPVIARELRVAPQAEHLNGGPPDPAYLALVEGLRAARALVPERNDLLYVSRTGMIARGKAVHAGESYLVDLLRKAGVAVLDPGAAPLGKQLALYSGARRIVFAEGSAVHGRQLLGRIAQEITILNRRPGQRIGEGALAARCDRLAYAEATDRIIATIRPDGTRRPARALSFYDLPVLFETFAGLGVDLRRDWDDAAYAAACEADIRAWLAGLPRGWTLEERADEAFLAAGLGPLDGWLASARRVVTG